MMHVFGAPLDVSHFGRRLRVDLSSASQMPILV